MAQVWPAHGPATPASSRPSWAEKRPSNLAEARELKVGMRCHRPTIAPDRRGYNPLTTDIWMVRLQVTAVSSFRPGGNGRFRPLADSSADLPSRPRAARPRYAAPVGFEANDSDNADDNREDADYGDGVVGGASSFGPEAVSKPRHRRSKDPGNGPPQRVDQPPLPRKGDRPKQPLVKPERASFEPHCPPASLTTGQSPTHTQDDLAQLSTLRRRMR